MHEKLYINRHRQESINFNSQLIELRIRIEKLRKKLNGQISVGKNLRDLEVYKTSIELDEAIEEYLNVCDNEKKSKALQEGSKCLYWRFWGTFLLFLF